MQTEVVWTSLPFFRSGQIYLAWHSEKGKKTRLTEGVRRQHKGMNRPGDCWDPEGSTWKTGCEVIGGYPTTITVKGWVKVKTAAAYHEWTTVDWEQNSCFGWPIIEQLQPIIRSQSIFCVKNPKSGRYIFLTNYSVAMERKDWLVDSKQNLHDKYCCAFMDDERWWEIFWTA